MVGRDAILRDMARPRQIDRDAVLRASLEIADTEGLDAITMQSVADRLGVTPMALYRHVDNKNDLLDGVVESLLDELPEPSDELSWDHQLAQMGSALRATARSHPAVFPLLLQLPANTPRARQRRDLVQDALRAAGVGDANVAQAERILSTIVLAFAACEVSGRFAAHSRETLDDDYTALEAFIKAGLTTLIDDNA